MRAQIQQQQQPICWLILRPWLCWALLLPLLLVQGRQHRRAQELFEVRVFEGAPVGTKATLNEAFDRALREMNSCFAQLESDLEWLDFDPVRLIFETVAELPQNSSRPAQYAVLHLLCPQHKHSLHFSLHITRRNRHAPKFMSSDYRFYAPVNLPIGAEIGRVQVQDQDPIIYNSQVQLSIIRATNPGPGSRGGSPSFPVGQSGKADMEEDPYWEVARNGSLLVRRRLTELRLFRPYQTRLLAVDFGSPQLFSMTNITIVPVSVSQPQNVRINVANSRYQIFQWGLPSFGVPERYRLTIRKKGELRPLFEQQLEDPIESMAMTRVRLPVGVQLEVQIAAVDVEGETPSEAVVFQAVDSELYCEGQCSARGLPMCHYSGTQQLEQYRDVTGLPHCLCFAGFSGAQCDRIENCPFERLLESYGGVDWPETPVNLSAAIPCPYNEDGRRLERQCGWERQREKASWGNATNPNPNRMAASSSRASGNGPSSGTDQEADGLCRSQSSVLVHLGVLANYGQRQEQTFSGLQSVMRFLATLLQFPAFQPAIPTAHFDAKIAEHVTQVLDSLVARNLSALGGGGNSSLLSDQVAKYAMEFIRRFPVPFTVQSASGSLQMRAWQVLPTAADSDPLDDPMANGQSVQQLGPCFVQPPPQRHGTRTARAICMRNATLFPLLEGHSPVLMLQMDDGGAENGTMGMESGTAGADGGPLVLGFRLPAASAIPSRENFTCAQFDQNEKVWSASGISVLSREFRPHGQILLCEIRASHQTKQSVFALLPESMFRPESVALAWLAKFGPDLGAIAVLVTCFCLLLSSALLHRNSDPAQLVLLLSLLLLHLFHLILLLRPQFSSAPFGLAWPSSSALFSTLQLALLSFCAALALLNSSIYSRIVQLELDIRKAPSRSARLFCTLIVTIFLPLSLCVLTSLFDGQILAGLDSDQTQLQPFNWTFGLALLLPLVIFMGSAMGFGAYGLWYGNKLASFASDWPLDSATLLRRRLLHQLSSAGGLSWLILLFPFANLLVLLQPPEPIRSIVMATLYLLTALSIFLFIRLLTRIGRRLPHSRESAVDQGPRSMRENTLVAPLENNHKSNGRNGVGGGHQSEKQQQKPVLVVQQQGLCQPIAPGEILFDTNNNNNHHHSNNNNNHHHSNNNNNGLNSPMIEQQTVDRQFLLKRSAVHQPSHQGPSQQLQLGQSQYRQLAIPASQQRHSGTVSTSAGTILLESDDLASLDRAIAAQMVPSNQAGLPANLFAEADTFDEDEEDEDLDAFLEQNPSDMLRSTSSRQQNGKAKSPSLAHPLVSVV